MVFRRLRPNNSFKPTPHRGVNSVLCATLHAVATPPRGGLTQALAVYGNFAMTDKEETLEHLAKFKHRLIEDVSSAYEQRGTDYGRERFTAWNRQFTKFLDTSLPGANARLNEKLQHGVYYRGSYESDYDAFMREDGEPCLAFIDSLRLDIEHDEYDFENVPVTNLKPREVAAAEKDCTKVFIVHGHDEALKTKAARFVEKLGFNAVILHEQASRGHTVIEKIEACTDVGFAIVLYTPDDLGNNKQEAEAGLLNARARQNVIFEHGYLIAKLSRSRVVPLLSGKLELPSDISGVVYVDDTNWQIDIAKEMKAAGYLVDFNRLLDS